MSENDQIESILSDVADAKKALEVAKNTKDKDLILMNGNSLVAQQNILTELLKKENLRLSQNNQDLLLATRGKFSLQSAFQSF
jgi:hypothetical protein